MFFYSAVVIRVAKPPTYPDDHKAPVTNNPTHLLAAQSPTDENNLSTNCRAFIIISLSNRHHEKYILQFSGVVAIDFAAVVFSLFFKIVLSERGRKKSQSMQAVQIFFPFRTGTETVVI